MEKKQIQVYSVDTNSFLSYNEKKKAIDEEKVNRLITDVSHEIKSIEEYTLIQLINNEKYLFNDIAAFIKYKNKNNKHLKKELNAFIKKSKQLIKEDKAKDEEYKSILKENGIYQILLKRRHNFKAKLNELLENNKETRKLNPDKVSKYNIVSLFDSFLIRTMGLKYNELTTDLIIVKVYHYSVMKQLLEKGFDFQDEHYKFYSSSAGQIRNKKLLMIKESTWNKIANTLMCGLTIDKINNSEHQGCNINKFLAYLALSNSATDVWESFDIDKAIVIDDFKTEVSGKVDYIDKKLNEAGIFELHKPIEKQMKINIEHSDGCGWVLPSESKKNFMVRLPWVKGLMTPVDYLTFCKEHNDGNYKIIDIYGKEWDLLEDDIRYIFSKSQFKMWKYYSNWQEYKDNFVKYDCHASICNIEPDSKDFKNKSFNYQMWQTLTDIKDEEIEHFTNPIVEFISKAYVDRNTMLEIMGVNNKNKSYMQEILSFYPELLNDFHFKNELSESINSYKKDAKAGKFKIKAKNTYFIPDVFAWMEYSLKGDKNPKGLLKSGEVSCYLYKKEPKLLVNRSPHLYREHGVKNNVINKEINKWFITNGVYTSSHDLISKLLMFDNDGDQALVSADHVLIEVAERNMQDIVPLYYVMSIANPQQINPKNIYDSLVNAFRYGNIGKYSNKLTALWNSNNFDLETIKIITALNNFSIDAAKTLEMPISKERISGKVKMPYFFQFAKDYNPGKVEVINDSTVNRICQKIENIKQGDFDFSAIGSFRRANLMGNKKIKDFIQEENLEEANQKIIEEYERLNKEMQKYFIKNKDMEQEEIEIATWDILRYEFSEFCNELNVNYGVAVDMVIEHIYTTNRNSRKSFLFNVFGDAILNNLRRNITKSFDKGYIQCGDCGKRIKKTSNNQIRCPECAKKANLKKTKLNKKVS